MCCLFGLIDYHRSLSAKQKNHILSILAAACEVRGTDATGIAYNSQGKLQIYKRPVPGHQLRFCVPDDAWTVMGHTRMATQGSAVKTEIIILFRGISGTEHLPWHITVSSAMTGNSAVLFPSPEQKSKRTAISPSSFWKRKMPSTSTA